MTEDMLTEMHRVLNAFYNPPLTRVDSTAAAPALTGQHVHVEAQNAATSGRTASDEAAGPGEQFDAG